uniref:SAM-dependent methyltransferase TRM5/TYW2-type domain-containing protein n=1 Tax=Lygus hesperus TaxID=30085 RepID=A0A0K8SZL3_LYGHE
MFMKWTPRSFCRSILLSSLYKMASTSPSPVMLSAEMETNNVLSVPECVRGMKVLDRDKFKKDLRVHCYFFEQAKATKALKVLKPYFLKIPAFQPIQEGHETCCRVAYLDPTKVTNGFQDLDLKARNTLLCLGLPGDTSVRKLTIGYNNFKADEILRAVIPKELDSVSGYSIIGHIIHLNLRPELEEYKSVIGSVLLDKVPNIQTVVTKTDSIDSTYRNFSMEVIAGKEAFETTTRENRCLFSLDFSKVYWNPRLSNEHQKVTNLLAKGDVCSTFSVVLAPSSFRPVKKV